MQTQQTFELPSPGEYTVSPIFYEKDGVKYPRNTSVISLAVRSIGLESWKRRAGSTAVRKTLEESQYRGKAVHSLIEQRIRGEKIEDPEFPEHLASFDRFNENYKPKWIFSEHTFFSKKGFATTVDGAAFIEDIPHREWKTAKSPVAVEFKTSKAIRESHLYQAAAENAVLREHDIPVVGALLVRITDKEHDEHYLTQKECNRYFRRFKAYLEHFHEFILPLFEGWSDEQIDNLLISL